MEQKAPRLSSASLVAGGMCIAFAILNGTADLAFNAGFSIEEIGSIGAGLVCFGISFFASRERPVPEMPFQPSIQEQYDAFESTPTPFRSPSAQPAPVMHHSQPVVASQALDEAFTALQATPAPPAITQAAAVAHPDQVASALASLTSGEFGANAAQQAASRPAPHVHTTQGREFTQAVGSLATTHQRTSVVDVPLPPSTGAGTKSPPESPSMDLLSMPDLDALLADSGPSLSPTPSVEIDELLAMTPNLTPPPVASPPPVSTPDLPNLDELF